MSRPFPHRSLIDLFRSSVRRHAARPALWVDRERLSYEELWREAGGIARSILQAEGAGHSHVGLLAQRSTTAYAGILGTLVAEKAYVPLNKHFPAARTSAVVERARCRTLVVAADCAAALAALLERTERRLTLVLCGAGSDSVRDELAPRFSGHTFLPCETAASSDLTPADSADASDVAYVMFTSGSTGAPKGVPISHANVLTYLDNLLSLFDLDPGDRFSQTFDLTFDLSVHDIFLTWAVGGCLYCLPEPATMAPAKFIRDHRLSVWFSVPSVIMVMDKLGLLAPGALSSLRLSFFCGEPLPEGLVRKWQIAAPESIIENLYGPTEATIAISHYRWRPDESPRECRNGITPIGWMFEGQDACVVDGRGDPVATGETGQLCLSGTQVAAGYLDDPQTTAQQFRSLPGREGTWYLTGDVACCDARGCYYYQGRMDSQVKIRGHRIELQEIEHYVRQAAQTEMVACLPWPVGTGLAESIYAFVPTDARARKSEILRHCAEHLAAYMVPREILLIDEMPLNPNGKIDRKRLAAMLQSRLDGPSSGADRERPD